ncbi:MAG: MotA/TolQ/ExbB proton channel family protein [Spongiibacteraceae bacterium]
MITKRLIPLLLQLVLASAGQQMMASVASAQEGSADAAAPVAEAPAAAEETAAAPVESAQSAATAAEEATTQHNPYGLDALWTQGDFVAKGTLILMGIMSAVTWFIMFTKLWEQQRLFAQAKEAKKLWDASSLSDGVQKLSKNSAYRELAEDGLKAVKHHDGKLTDRIELQDWVNSTVQRNVEAINSALQGGLAFLATTGSTAPFIGLFGTVWGIYHALVAIGLAGQASIDKVAGPVGEALIMTAIGLAVAVPAVLGYNWLVRRNKVAMEDVRNFANDLHAYLVVGARIGGEQGLTTRGK